MDLPTLLHFLFFATPASFESLINKYEAELDWFPIFYRTRVQKWSREKDREAARMIAMKETRKSLFEELDSDMKNTLMSTFKRTFGFKINLKVNMPIGNRNNSPFDVLERGAGPLMWRETLATVLTPDAVAEIESQISALGGPGHIYSVKMLTTERGTSIAVVLAD